MILLLGGGLPALAVAHFEFCSGTSDACRHGAALSLSHFLSREQNSAYLPFFSLHPFLKFWVVVIIFLTGKELVDRPWTEQRNTVKCDSQCIYYHCSRWYVVSIKLCWSSKARSLAMVIEFFLSGVTERMYLCNATLKSHTFKWCGIIYNITNTAHCLFWQLQFSINWTNQLIWILVID